ncbi:unnamed protein product [Paramecium sonneborni]|uniref:Uncharacterized protein n=1 Tax=Paramecium sonneborni TaxID=65129 RepID=A0A8S1N0R0_9CILI|nr:unnamed protein product [Paramecium sonneborni]
MIEKYSLALICLIGITLSQIILSSMDDCTCRQILTDFECQNMQPYCQWNGASCQQQSCYDVPLDQCTELSYCYLNGQSCQQFYNQSMCQELVGNATQNCQQLSQYCYGNNGQCSNQITVLPSQCSSYTNQSECFQSQQGRCTWYNNTCNYYSSCNSIPLANCQQYQPFETKQQLGQYCRINNNQCVQATCNLITNQTQCTFVQNFFNIDQFMLCQWNTTSSSCQMAISTSFLSNTTCLQYTMGNYHWVTRNNQTTEGYCFKCQVKPIISKKQCSCEQLISQQDCYQNPLCTWQFNQCIIKPCSAFNSSQEQCVLNSACAWIEPQGCTNFTKCQNLNGTNQYECLLQSLNCPSSNGYNCFPRSENNQYGCAANQNGQCERFFTNGGFCQTYHNQTYYNQTQYTCRYIESPNCQFITNQQECQRFSQYCNWESYNYNPQLCSECAFNPYYCSYCGTCYNYYQSCSNFYNENQCKYANEGGQFYKCVWNYNTQRCVNSGQNGQYNGSNIIPFDQDDCYTQTDGQYRWSSNTDKAGECLKCSVVYLPRKRNQCTCEQLIYQGDCALAGDSCLWNPQLGQCVQMDCNMLKTRSTCVSNYNCHWIQVDDVMQCLPFTKCSNLPGSNSLQCLTYSYRCTQSDGRYCKELSRTDVSNTCSSIQNYTLCYLTIASDGVCAWNGSSCYALSECSSIKQFNLCGINNYGCYWNQNTSSCVPLQCSNILSQSQCTYVDNTIDRQHSIQMCFWNQTFCQNVTTISESLTSSNCYINSGKTYSWSQNNSTQGTCQSCSDSIIKVALLILLVFINY